MIWALNSESRHRCKQPQCQTTEQQPCRCHNPPAQMQETEHLPCSDPFWQPGGLSPTWCPCWVLMAYMTVPFPGELPYANGSSLCCWKDFIIIAVSMVQRIFFILPVSSLVAFGSFCLSRNRSISPKYQMCRPWVLYTIPLIF